MELKKFILNFYGGSNHVEVLYAPGGVNLELTGVGGAKVTAYIPNDIPRDELRYKLLIASNRLSTLSSDAVLEKAWGLLGDIPINDNDEIESEFNAPSHKLHFPVGTNRFDIWREFDNLHSMGVAHLLGFHTAG